MPAAAAVGVDGWFAFVNYMVNNKRLCCRDGDPRCVLEDPSRRWLDDAAALIVAGFVASTSSCNEINDAKLPLFLPILSLLSYDEFSSTFCFGTRSSLESLRAIKRLRRRYGLLR